MILGAGSANSFSRPKASPAATFDDHAFVDIRGHHSYGHIFVTSWNREPERLRKVCDIAR